MSPKGDYTGQIRAMANDSKEAWLEILSEFAHPKHIGQYSVYLPRIFCTPERVGIFVQSCAQASVFGIHYDFILR